MNLGRVVYYALGAAEVLVDAYGWAKRLFTPKEQAFPLTAKDVALIEAQKRSAARPFTSAKSAPAAAPSKGLRIVPRTAKSPRDFEASKRTR